MNEKFFPELARRLRVEGVATGPSEKDRLPVLLNGQEAMWVEPQGSVVIAAKFADDPEASRIYETVRGLYSPVYEYTEAVASAPVLKAVGLHEEYRLLAEYNDVVLAGRELEQNLGYQFVTWRRNYDRTAVAHGNYYYNDYDGAKLDFACRSGLVQFTRQFTDEQLVELYRCIHETLESGYPITREREDILRAAAERIESSVGDLADRVMRSNEQELAAARQRPEPDGEHPETIEIYWQDLTPAKQSEILRAFGETATTTYSPSPRWTCRRRMRNFPGRSRIRPPAWEWRCLHESALQKARHFAVL